jgi:large subunit ribosomal protein L1
MLIRPSYLRAFEVGKTPSGIKYDIAIRLKTTRSGPVVRNSIKLPHPVKSSAKFGVICPEGSKAAEEARQAGAVAVGEASLFEKIRNGETPYDQLLCHEDSEQALKEANLGRILGPKGLMPNRKLGTITSNIARSMAARSSEYRERMGVVRLVIGQLGFTPRMLADNVKTLVGQVKKECLQFEDQFIKEVREVVLSTSKGPGLSLNGKFSSTDETITEEHLSGVM